MVTDKTYSILDAIQKGAKSPKLLFDKVKGVFNGNLEEFQSVVNQIQKVGYINFPGGNTNMDEEVVLTDRGKDYIKQNKPLLFDPDELEPCMSNERANCGDYFIRDVELLCITCPIRTKISSVRQTMILKYETLKSLNTKDYLISHLNKKIVKSNKKIEGIFDNEKVGGDLYRERRVAFLLSWKDCLQYYTEQLKLLKENIDRSELLSNKTEQSNVPNFYNKTHFQKIVDELPLLDPLLQVKDYLEYHYSNSVSKGLMGKMNWFTMLRQTLFQNGYKDDKDSINNLPAQVRTAFWWGKQKSMDVLKANPPATSKQIEIKPKAEAKEELQKEETKIVDHPPVIVFDYSNKEGYFLADCLEAFKTIENELVKRNFFSKNGQWVKGKMNLVAFIHFMSLGYLKRKLHGKEGRPLLNEYKRFFQNRYKVDISKEFQPTVFKIAKLKRYKPEFHFIPDIDNL